MTIPQSEREIPTCLFILNSMRKKKIATRPMRTRFAPSPTGELHLGHAYSALTAWKAAGQSAELFCLRIDDLDHTRCRPAYTKQIKDDLSWLGLQWAETPLVQSKRLQRYAEALEKLKADKLLYPCYLTRREINSLLSAPHDSSEQAPAPSTSCLLYTSPSPRDRTRSRMPSSA